RPVRGSDLQVPVKADGWAVRAVGLVLVQVDFDVFGLGQRLPACVGDGEVHVDGFGVFALWQLVGDCVGFRVHVRLGSGGFSCAAVFGLHLGFAEVPAARHNRLVTAVSVDTELEVVGGAGLDVH